jgi:hypothetical protein
MARVHPDPVVHLPAKEGRAGARGAFQRVLVAESGRLVPSRSHDPFSTIMQVEAVDPYLGGSREDPVRRGSREDPVRLDGPESARGDLQDEPVSRHLTISQSGSTESLVVTDTAFNIARQDGLEGRGLIVSPLLASAVPVSDVIVSPLDVAVAPRSSPIPPDATPLNLMGGPTRRIPETVPLHAGSRIAGSVPIPPAAAPNVFYDLYRIPPAASPVSNVPVTVAPRRRENQPARVAADILAEAARVREENARLLKQIATSGVPGPPVEPLATVLEAENEQDNESASSPRHPSSSSKISASVTASVLTAPWSAVAVPAIPSPPAIDLINSHATEEEEELHAKEVNKLLDMVDTLSRLGYDAAPIKGAVDRLSNLSLRAQSISQRLPSPSTVVGAVGNPPVPAQGVSGSPVNAADSPGMPPRLL